MANEGTIRIFELMNSNWDPYTTGTSYQTFIQDNILAIGSYTPYWDAKLSWFPNTWVYVDSYAIYNDTAGNALIAAHPTWVCRDGSGNPLYIPFGCSGGSCPQYAGNIADAGFRAYMVTQIGTYLAPGYVGLWFDDVNLDITKVANGSGVATAPIDPATGLAMTSLAWNTYFAAWVAQVRAAYPSINILHNPLWYVAASTQVNQQISAANIINLEHGFGDTGLTNGTGQFSVYAFMNYIDHVHSMGRSVVIQNYFLADLDYGTAGYYLISNGTDYLAFQDMIPPTWPTATFALDLGDAVAGRYQWSGLWRRDFSGGMVLLNEPGNADVTVTLPVSMYDANGVPLTTVTLGAKQGIVLGSTVTPPAPTPVTPPPPVPAVPVVSVGQGLAVIVPRNSTRTISMAFGVYISNAAGNLIIVSVGATVNATSGSVTLPVVVDQQGGTFLQANWVDGSIQSPGSGIFYRQNMTPGSYIITFSVLAHNGNPVFDIAYELFTTVTEVPLVGAILQSQGIQQQGAGTVDLARTLTDSHGTSITSDAGTYSQAVLSVADFSVAGFDFFAAAIMSDRPSTAPTVSPPSFGYVLAQRVSVFGASYNLALFTGGVVPVGPPFPPFAGPPAWLVIDEPTLGQTDRTDYLFKGDAKQHNFTQQLRQRGQATVDLYVAAGDSYAPTRGTQLWLYDQTQAGYILVFSGLIQDVENQWQGDSGDRYVIITAVSLESVFDTVYATPVGYSFQTAGGILTDLYNRFETGSQVTLGIVSPGPVIPQFNTDYQKLSDIFDQLATTAGFTWNVQVLSSSVAYLNFEAPTLGAPWTVIDSDVLWASAGWKVNGADYRNRQAIRVNFDAFGHSSELFVGAGQQVFTLMRPVEQVTNAWATLSTQNFATGSFSGQPAPGDTVTIGLPTGTWLANHAYALGGSLLDTNGHIQTVIGAGTSGLVQPVWNNVGGSTADNTVLWHDQGPAALSSGQDIYTFVGTLDNTQFGQVLIGATSADTALNLVDAINSNQAEAGLTFSLPTWEAGIVNAVNYAGTSFTVVSKAAGTSNVAALSSTGSAFSWSAPQTGGGTSPQGSLGPGLGATIALNVGILGTAIAAPGLAYTPGSPVVSLTTPLNFGSNLQVEYTRAGGDVIQVENTPAVVALAALSHGTGKYQQIFSAGNTLVSVSAVAALQLAQNALAAFDVAPTALTFDTHRAGLQVGYELDVSMTHPTGGTTLLNGQWVIEEIDAELVPVIHDVIQTFPLGPNTGHYKYTIRAVNIQEIGDYLDFWEGLGGGGAGSGGTGSGLVATNGGGLAVQPGSPTTVEISGILIGLENAINFIPGTAVTITGVDNLAAGSVDVTINSTGSTTVELEGVVVATEPNINFIAGSDILITAVDDPTNHRVDVTISTIGASSFKYTASFSATADVPLPITHNLGSSAVLVQVFDGGSPNLMVNPQKVAITDANTVTLTFGNTFAGYVVVMALPIGKYTAGFSAVADVGVPISHGLATTAVIVQVNESGVVVEPQQIAINDANTVTLTFGGTFAGTVVVMG